MAKVNVSRALHGFPGGSQPMIRPFPIFSKLGCWAPPMDSRSASGSSIPRESTAPSNSGMKCCCHTDKSGVLQGRDERSGVLVLGQSKGGH